MTKRTVTNAETKPETCTQTEQKTDDLVKVEAKENVPGDDTARQEKEVAKIVEFFNKQDEQPSPRPDLTCPKAIARRKFYEETDPCQ
jgi:hypothetical protein